MAKSDPKKRDGVATKETVRQLDKTRSTKNLPTVTDLTDLMKAKHKNYVISSEFEASRDIVRESLRRYWVNLGNEVEFSRSVIPSSILLEEKERKVTQILNFEDGNVYDGISQTLKVSNDTTGPADLADPLAAFGTTEAFFDALETLQDSNLIETIEVYNFNLDKPVEYPTRYTTNVSSIRPEAEISFNYNYGLQNYEQFISDESISETELLNYYTDYNKINNLLNNAISKDRSAVKKDVGTRSKLNLNKGNTRETIDNRMVSKTKSKNIDDKNVIVLDYSIEDVFSKNENILSLPFYNKIDIGKSCAPREAGELNSNIKKTILSQKKKSKILGSDPGIYDKVANYCLQLTSPGANPEFYSQKDFSYSLLEPRFKDTEQTTVDLIKQIETDSMFAIDAYDMVQNLGDNSISLNSQPQEVTLIGSNKLAVGKTKILELKNQIEELLDASKTEKTQNDYKQILTGKANFYTTDVIMYKISKFSEDDLQNPIQNIFLPNVKSDQLSYIDFQVKYGKKYVYKVYAYKFVSGTNYSLSVIKNEDSSAYAKYIEEYDKLRSMISIKQYEISDPDTFDGIYQKLLTNFNRVINNDLRNINRDSFRLRGTIKALELLRDLNKIGITEAISEGDGTLEQILSDIKERLGSVSTAAVALTVESRTLSSESKEKLELARDLINQFKNELSSLISELGSINNKTGLGKNTTERKIKALEFKNQMEQFLETEEEMIAAISNLERSDVEENFNINQKNLTGFTYPVIQLMEVPYFEDAGAILDNPPVFPDINFIPYKGNSKNISFFITSGVGKVTDNPIIFNNEEAEYYSLWRESKKYNDLEPILYISDEVQNLGASFEIYRLDSAPSSYLDFINQNSLYQTVSESFKEGTNKLPSVSFLERVRPNKTYYYMFRQRDQRGVISNPSAVFSVLLVDEGGLVFPIIEQYEFPEEEKDYKRSLRKLLNISPSINQITPRTSKSGTYESYASKKNINRLMGLTDEGLFGKTFKIRFTSKKTGKQLDLNITFETELASD